ncbi:DcaP family trimeric outer membrane transporter [uncultured Oceanisphaera sp.]|uniref:DcaP family trimeric outer membrane transporter n=1 Tax=uncultured Oceanisphaera sp. TaxID=353858 RepID=UPI002610FB1C|nr:DcaP family trimeric outer membrane transporter [uncultured Oceanisphaera sp.]
MRKTKVALSVFLATGILSGGALAMPVVEAGQPIVTGEPSRVGPPWNHRTTINIPGTTTDFAFGGYVKLDMLYDADYDLGYATSPFNLLNPTANATDGRTDFTAYETRLNFRTQTQTDYGKLNTFFEVHFLPDGKLNLRHAYGEYAGFLAGQTWTNFMSFVGSTRTLALGDPIGYNMERQGQLRYTHKQGDGALSVALEDPDTVIARPDLAIASEESRLPDLTLRYEYRRQLALSGVVRELSTNDNIGSVDDRATGYGVQAQFSLPLLESTNLKGSYTIGSGIGNYMGNPGNMGHKSAPDVYVRNGELETVDIQGGGISLNHNWNPLWFSSVGYSRLDQDLPKAQGYDAHFDEVDYTFANVIWDITERLMVGAEYQFVDLKTIAGDQRDASRLQLSAQYQF